jgi:hypothetical protein
MASVTFFIGGCMSLFSWIGELFEPATKIVDELHYSGEEKGKIEIRKAELKNKLAEIESRVSTKLLELQEKSLDANMKVAIAEQKHGNWLSKSWRPVCSIGMLALLLGMGFGAIEFNTLLAQIAGGFLGIYGMGRSWEKKK